MHQHADTPGNNRCATNARQHTWPAAKEFLANRQDYGSFKPARMIRQATIEDQSAIQELIFPILRSYGFAPCLHTTDRDLSDIQRYYLDRGGYFALLIENHRIIGTVAITDNGDGVCELRRMYLAPSHRRRGLGKLLLSHALETAQRMGFRRVVLETSSVLVEAIALYQTAGFRPLDCGALAAPCDQAFFLDLPV